MTLNICLLCLSYRDSLSEIFSPGHFRAWLWDPWIYFSWVRGFSSYHHVQQCLPAEGAAGPMDGRKPGAWSLGEVHTAAAALAAGIQGGTEAAATSLQSLRWWRQQGWVRCSLAPNPVEPPGWQWLWAELHSFGKARAILLMGFSACDPSCASSVLSVSSPGPLCPHVLVPSPFRLLTCIFSFLLNLAIECLISRLNEVLAYGQWLTTLTFPRDISGSWISLPPPLQ